MNDKIYQSVLNAQYDIIFVLKSLKIILSTKKGILLPLLMIITAMHGYICLLHDKSQAVNALEIFIKEIKRQLDKKVKIVRLDRGREYYGRYDESGQHLGPFAKFLEKRAVYVLNTQCQVHHNKMVSERCNRTLVDIYAWLGL